MGKLTDQQCRGAKATGTKRTKLSDGEGLQLWVSHHSKTWRLAYRFDGRQRMTTLGTYPAMTLAKARLAAAEWRVAVAKGIDPAAPVAAPVTAPTFRAMLAEAERMLMADKAPKTQEKWRWHTGQLATLFDKPIDTITVQMIDAALQDMARRGLHASIRRARADASRVFRVAIRLGHCTSDPAVALVGLLPSHRVTHRPALTDPQEVAGLLRAIAGYHGWTVQTGLRLLFWTLVRPGELRFARWPEIDLEARVWSIPADRMKMRRPHRVPLPRQAVEVLAGMRPAQGEGYVLPSARPGRPLSENTFNAALRAMGYDGSRLVAHGIRSIGSTLLNESRQWHPDAIERQLAHHDSRSVRSIYDRSEHWDERVRMMQWWADRLDQLRGG
ncbi:MAG: DUF4102 domain-containing protein [Alphaproteobacteria bacterium]|nr:MAG: DUF4102 domain-containing protein [Alphaproteobacteria bacterium]